MKALVVDGDRELCLMLEVLLGFSDVQVEHVQTGEEALFRLKAEPVDLVILDLLLPGSIDGFDVRRIMLADERMRRVPCLVLSAIEMSDEEKTELQIPCVIRKRSLLGSTLDDFLGAMKTAVYHRQTLATRIERRRAK